MKLDEINEPPVIVSRHPAAIEFIRYWIAEKTSWQGDAEDVEVISHATEEEVRGRIVFGNIPLQLGVIAQEVYALEFDDPPRGQEYTLAEMIEAGARLVPYVVCTDWDLEHAYAIGVSDGLQGYEYEENGKIRKDLLMRSKFRYTKKT